MDFQCSLHFFSFIIACLVPKKKIYKFLYEYHLKLTTPLSWAFNFRSLWAFQMLLANPVWFRIILCVFLFYSQKFRFYICRDSHLIRNQDKTFYTYLYSIPRNTFHFYFFARFSKIKMTICFFLHSLFLRQFIEFYVIAMFAVQFAIFLFIYLFFLSFRVDLISSCLLHQHTHIPFSKLGSKHFRSEIENTH